MKAFQIFKEQDLQQRLLVVTMEGLRQQQINIKKLSLNQLALLVDLVAKHQPKDLKVFYTYIDAGFEQRVFDVRPSSFGPMSDLICLFVDQGFLVPSKPSNLYLTYLLSLKNELVSSDSRLSDDKVISVAWALMAMEAPGARTNPLLVKLLERVHKFERADKPLSRHELVQLY